MPRISFGQFRHYFMKHLRAIDILEPITNDQDIAFGLAQREFQLVQAIGRVDIDKDRADFGCGELEQYPWNAIRGPDPNVLALFYAEREKSTCNTVDLLQEPGVGQASVFEGRDQRFILGELRADLVQHLADSFADERLRRHA